MNELIFFTAEFYESTRLTCPDERACLVDLLTYQYRHGQLPKEYKQILPYCTGITENTLCNTLANHFIPTSTSFVYARLRVMQFKVAAQELLPKKEYNKLMRVLKPMLAIAVCALLDDKALTEQTIRSVQQALISPTQAKDKDTTPIVSYNFV